MDLFSSSCLGLSLGLLSLVLAGLTVWWARQSRRKTLKPLVYKPLFSAHGNGMAAKLHGLHPSDLSSQDQTEMVEALIATLKSKLRAEKKPNLRIAVSICEGCIQLTARYYWQAGEGGEGEEEGQHLLTSSSDDLLDESELRQLVPSAHDLRGRVTQAALIASSASPSTSPAPLSQPSALAPQILSLHELALPTGSRPFSFSATVFSPVLPLPSLMLWRPAVSLSLTFDKIKVSSVRWAPDPLRGPGYWTLSATCDASKTVLPQVIHLTLESYPEPSAGTNLSAPASPKKRLLSNEVGCPLLPLPVVEELGAAQAGPALLQDIFALLDLAATPVKRPQSETRQYEEAARSMSGFCARAGLQNTRTWIDNYLQLEIRRFCGHPPALKQGGQTAARLAVLLHDNGFFMWLLLILNQIRASLGLVRPVPQWVLGLAKNHKQMRTVGGLLLQIAFTLVSVRCGRSEYKEPSSLLLLVLLSANALLNYRFPEECLSWQFASASLIRSCMLWHWLPKLSCVPVPGPPPNAVLPFLTALSLPGLPFHLELYFTPIGEAVLLILLGYVFSLTAAVEGIFALADLLLILMRRKYHLSSLALRLFVHALNVTSALDAERKVKAQLLATNRRGRRVGGNIHILQNHQPL